MPKNNKPLTIKIFDKDYQDDRGDSNYINLIEILDGSEHPNEILPKFIKIHIFKKLKYLL